MHNAQTAKEPRKDRYAKSMKDKEEAMTIITGHSFEEIGDVSAVDDQMMCVDETKMNTDRRGILIMEEYRRDTRWRLLRERRPEDEATCGEWQH